MISISYILGGLVALLTISQIILDHHLKHLPEVQKKKKRKLRVGILWLTLVLFVANQTIAAFDHIQKDRQAGEAKKFIGSLHSTVTNLVKMNKDLLDMLGTNNSVDTTTRTKLLAYQQQFDIVSGDAVDLPQWSEAKKRRELLSELKRQEDRKLALQPTWDVSVPVYEYTVNLIQGMLSQISTQRAERLVSTFGGIPKELSFGSRGEIWLGTNSNWHFRIRTYETPGLRIENGSVGLNVEASPSHVLVSFASHCAYADYQTNVDAGLRDLLVQVADADASRKTP